MLESEYQMDPTPTRGYFEVLECKSELRVGEFFIPSLENGDSVEIDMENRLELETLFILRAFELEE